MLAPSFGGAASVAFVNGIGGIGLCGLDLYWNLRLSTSARLAPALKENSLSSVQPQPIYKIDKNAHGRGVVAGFALREFAGPGVDLLHEVGTGHDRLDPARHEMPVVLGLAVVIEPARRA